MIQGADIGDPATAHTGVHLLVSQCILTVEAVYEYSLSDHAITMLPQVLLFTGDRRMPRWQYFFFLCLRAFVCDITPHANLQIIESQGNNSRRLFCPLTTPVVAADAVILPKSTLAETQMRPREKTPSGKHPQGSSPWTSGQSGSCGRFWPKQMLLFSKFKVCLSASSDSIVFIFYASEPWWKYRSLVCFWLLVSSGDLFKWQSSAKWQKWGKKYSILFVCDLQSQSLSPIQ